MSATTTRAEAGDIGSPVLDNPAWASLTGYHAHLAELQGRAGRFLPEVSPFIGLAGPDAWDDLRALIGAGNVAVVTGSVLDSLPAGWEFVEGGEGLQFVATSLEAAPDPQAVRLGVDDVPEMLELVARTQPGPFLPRTVDLGTYLGLRRDGRLVAMAGERMHPPGWVEISAVCTDAAHRGQGLASRLVRAVAHGIAERGEQAFLHTAATNATAIQLYTSLGFTLRRRTTFAVVRSPVRERETIRRNERSGPARGS